MTVAWKGREEGEYGRWKVKGSILGADYENISEFGRQQGSEVLIIWLLEE